jgi:hypothetical protein
MIIESGLVKAGLVKAGLVRAISNINTRYFRRNEGTTDYATIPEVTLVGDFVISADFWIASLTTTQGVVGKASGSSSDFIAVLNTSGNIRVKISTDSDINFTNLTASTTIKNTLLVVRTGTNLTVTLNGLSETLVCSTNSLTIDELYSIGQGFNFSGILANLKIWDNGTPIRDYKLNDNSDILANSATVLGGELWNGIAEFPADTTITAASGTSAGMVYLTTISGLSGSEDFRFSGQSGFESVGNGTFALTAAGSSMQFRSIGVSESGVAISIRQADGYGTVINGNAEDWGLFTEQAVFWKGKDLAVPPWDSVDQELPKA